jgi:CRISPR-associated protein (TIGR03984 family)
MHKRALNIKKIECSKSILSEIQQQFDNELEGVYLLLYTLPKVLVSQYLNGQWQFPSDFVLNEDDVSELRAWNTEKELYLWRKGDGFSGRLLEEAEGENLLAYSEPHLLYGSRYDQDSEMIIDDKLGARFRLAKSLAGSLPEFSKFSYKLINYLEKNELTGLAEIKDSRIVSINLKGAKNG